MLIGVCKCCQSEGHVVMHVMGTWVVRAWWGSWKRIYDRWCRPQSLLFVTFFLREMEFDDKCKTVFMGVEEVCLEVTSYRWRWM